MTFSKVVFLIAVIANSFVSHSQTVSDNNINASESQIKCLFFFIPECPASRNNMNPLMRLQQKYGALGLRVVAILSDPHPDAEILAKTIKEHHLNIPLIYDSTLVLAQKYGVTTTPQLVLLNDLKEKVYSGAMDNYYYSFGLHRSRPSKYYLRDAIEATLNQRLPDIQVTDPIGCKINFE